MIEVAQSYFTSCHIFVYLWNISTGNSDVTRDVSLQTNEAYCTVTTGVPMKINEAYESVLRTETDSPNTQHTYETVH